MNSQRMRSNRQSGVGLIEVLITLFVLLLGILGVAALVVQSQRAGVESYQRNQALLLLQDMVGRINANRNAANCYAISDATTGLPYLGTGSGVIPSCGTST